MRAIGASEPEGGRGSVLYVVGTPIGNLGDLTPRAREILAAVDLIACEDTRRTGRLLAHAGIQAVLVAHHEHNEEQSASGLMALFGEGKSIALVADAGTPAISDPGFLLVRLAHEQGVPVVSIPGPSALIAALSVAGLPTNRFSFEGFLPAAAGKRRARLRELAEQRRLFGGQTLVFYEAPGRTVSTLEDLAETLGAVEVALCRELTKMHEEVRRGTAPDLARQLGRGSLRGEVVLVVDTRSAEPPAVVVPDEERAWRPWLQQALELLREGQGERETRRALRRSGVPKEAAKAVTAQALRQLRGPLGPT